MALGRAPTKPPIAQRGFCAECGSCSPFNTMTLLKSLSCLAFDQPQELTPRYHYGVEGRLPWVDIGQGEQRNEERYGQRALLLTGYHLSLVLQLLAAAGANQNRFLSKGRFPFLAPAFPEFFF
jgi:hypothetical protein